MTDEELIARLRSNIFGTGTTMLAADRIEALVKEQRARHANPADFRYWEGRYRDEKARAERLEAALHRIQEGRYGKVAAIARTALKGADHV